MDEISSLLQGDLLSENPEQAVSSFGRHRVITDRWKGMNRDQLMAFRYSQQQQVLEKLVFKLMCIFCIPDCNNNTGNVCRRKYCCSPCASRYKTVFSIDLNFTQTLINQTEHSVSEAAGKCHGPAGVGWSSGAGLGGRLLWGPGPRGPWDLEAWSMVPQLRSTVSCTAQDRGFMVRFRT